MHTKGQAKRAKEAMLTLTERRTSTQDAIDSLDLSDNAILSLSNLPRLTRLSSLSLANNPITQISGNVGTQLPNLRSLTLSGSQVRPLSPQRASEAKRAAVERKGEGPGAGGGRWTTQQLSG